MDINNVVCSERGAQATLRNRLVYTWGYFDAFGGIARTTTLYLYQKFNIRFSQFCANVNRRLKFEICPSLFWTPVFSIIEFHPVSVSEASTRNSKLNAVEKTSSCLFWLSVFRLGSRNRLANVVLHVFHRSLLISRDGVMISMTFLSFPLVYSHRSL